MNATVYTGTYTSTSAGANGINEATLTSLFVQPTGPPPSSNSPLENASLTSLSSKTTDPGATSPASTSPASTSPAASITPAASDGRLPNGTVSGIVVAVAVGVALITFIATFLATRRKRPSRDEWARRPPEPQELPTDGSPSRNRGSKGRAIAEKPMDIPELEGYFPQSADDRTVQIRVTTALEQIALHVENYYQSSMSKGSQPVVSKLAYFNSPYLPQKLSTLLPTSRISISLIKHTLGQLITSSIAFTTRPDSSLLPTEFVLLPSTTSHEPMNSDLAQAMSRWRMLTAHLRPHPSQDTAYIFERDRNIKRIVELFSEAFAPWRNPRHRAEDRNQSLSALLKEAADLGIWMFAQPCTLQFRWLDPRETDPYKIAVAPALVKTTDAKGRVLGQPLVLVDMEIQEARA